MTERQENKIKKYDLFILLPNLTDEEIDIIDKDILKILEKVGVELIKVKKMGKRKLSYAINKFRHGVYIDYVIEMDVEKNDELIKEIKMKQEILRFELADFQESIDDINQVVKKEQEESKEVQEQENNKEKQPKKDNKKEEKVEKEEEENKDIDTRLDNILNKEMEI